MLEILTKDYKQIRKNIIKVWSVEVCVCDYRSVKCFVLKTFTSKLNVNHCS